MATAKQDFTFHVDSVPSFPQSPPLWQFSCSSTSNSMAHVTEAERDDEKKYGLSLVQESKASATSRRMNYLHFDGDEKEEKMDHLWEDLNEETSGNSGKVAQRCGGSRRKVQMGHQLDDHKSWKLSKANRGTISAKKASILVVVDVLKKMLAMPNSPRSVKNRVW